MKHEDVAARRLEWPEHGKQDLLPHRLLTSRHLLRRQPTVGKIRTQGEDPEVAYVLSQGVDPEVAYVLSQGVDPEVAYYTY